MSERPGVSECSEAVVDHYGVTFTCLGSSLDKLNSKQEILAVRVHQEGEKLSEELAKHKVEQMISITNIYRNKLVKIKVTACGSGQFTCDDGQCVPIDERCNQISNCRFLLKLFFNSSLGFLFPQGMSQMRMDAGCWL